jgi:hypothetical protein
MGAGAGLRIVFAKGAVDKPLGQWIAKTRRLICVDSPTGSHMDYWHKSFKYPITPKCGPMPQMSSLVDARGAFLQLPQGFLRRPHWLRAGKALLTASQTGRLIDIQWAFDTLVAAVDEEGWFDRRGESIVVEPPPPDQTAHPPETECLTVNRRPTLTQPNWAINI